MKKVLLKFVIFYMFVCSTAPMHAAASSSSGFDSMMQSFEQALKEHRFHDALLYSKSAWDYTWPGSLVDTIIQLHADPMALRSPFYEQLIFQACYRDDFYVRMQEHIPAPCFHEQSLVERNADRPERVCFSADELASYSTFCTAVNQADYGRAYRWLAHKDGVMLTHKQRDEVIYVTLVNGPSVILRRLMLRSDVKHHINEPLQHSDGAGYAPLTVAALFKKATHVQALLDYNVDQTKINEDNITPLFAACYAVTPSVALQMAQIYAQDNEQQIENTRKRIHNLENDLIRIEGKITYDPLSAPDCVAHVVRIKKELSRLHQSKPHLLNKRRSLQQKIEAQNQQENTQKYAVIRALLNAPGADQCIQKKSDDDDRVPCDYIKCIPEGRIQSSLRNVMLKKKP